ncbi:hypothetical protein FRC14_006669 [Serendipita sp. 396]|nr:hypothetical protein FRC14_006669 [Serendipita sp. 396]
MATQTTDSQQYQANEKIIVAIDLGTTHSAVCFAHACPGSEINIRTVTRWRGQPESAGDSKIPTLVAYKQGKLVACGAEARDYLGEEEYEVSRWFKLHLHPDSMKISDHPPTYGSSTNTSPMKEIPPLPSNVSLTKVYSDFLRYMFGGFQAFFEDSTPNGASIWNRLSSDMIIVLTIPNGWDTRQQGFLKQAAQVAGMVQSDDDADFRIEFVSEGEASVHYVLSKVNHRTWLKKDVMFVVTDAGGSTVDSTLYVCKELVPNLVLEEVCASECVQAGGVFIDRAARATITEKLLNSKYGDDDSINDIVYRFEQRTKRLFDGSQNSNVIEFGTRRDNDRDCGIIQGKLTLTNLEVSAMFDPAIARSIDSCLKLLGGRKIRHLLLVGGFGESLYLRLRLKEEFGSGVEVVTVEEPSKKAAAEGAMSWYIKRMVASRVARLTIGLNLSIPFNPKDKSHMERRNQVFISVSGKARISEFSVIIEKGQHIPQEFRVKHDFQKEFAQLPQSLNNFQLNLLTWEGDGVPRWSTDIRGKLLPQMRSLCTLGADLTPTISSIKKQRTQDGVEYWLGAWAIGCIYGGTKLQASLEWKEGDRECRGPAKVVPGNVLQ